MLREGDRSGAETWVYKTSVLQNHLILLMPKSLRRDKRGTKGRLLNFSRTTLATATPEECEERPD